MVTNIYMKCDVCESVINVKWQVGHVEEAPVSIVCPDCLTVLKFTLYTDNEEVKINFKSKNASEIKQTVPKYFAETSSELLTYKIAYKFFEDSRIAANACLLLGLATYLWDYSQAAWPHSTSTFFIISAFDM